MDVLYKLAQVILPTCEYLDNEELFLRKEEKCLKLTDQLEPSLVYKFNTWMNTFAAKKYYYYCDLGELYLNISVTGSCVVNIYGTNKTTAFGIINTLLVSEYVNDSANLIVKNAKEYDAIYFEIVSSSASVSCLKSAYWCTDKAPLTDNKLAVICCTYKREDYISKNIRKFEAFKSDNPEISEKINLFISDNGRTLPANLNSKNVTIYPNINAGGAGGFTRGVIEVMQLNAGYTRVLFMDDDVEMFPESFFKTLMLTNYLKKEFADSVVNGAMLDLNKKSRFVESMAVANKIWVKPYHAQCDLKSYESVIDSNNIDYSIFEDDSTLVSSAWWYCSFPLKIFEEKGLPLPLFFRCDDIEYSWRNKGLHHIQMNGVCVWHAPFEWRVSKVTEFYFSRRNYCVVSLIYNKMHKTDLLSYFKKAYRNLIDVYDYTGAEIFLKMVEDFINIKNVYMANPEDILKNVIEYAKADLSYQASNVELLKACNYNSKPKWYRILLYILTDHGRFCPSFLYKKAGISLDVNYPSKKDFRLIRSVRCYNLLTHQYTIRAFDLQKVVSLNKRFNALLNLVDARFDSILNDINYIKTNMTTVEFWKKYLNIGN